MTVRGSAEDRIVVGYFSDGAQAYRAINELIDEGFHASEVGAAFRTPRTATGPQPASTASGEMKGVRELTETNPAVSGSVGGAGSQDQAVTPAGLAPGSGNAFPGAPTSPGPIPGTEIPSTIPSTLKHDLPQTLPHDIPSTSAATAGTGGTAGGAGGERWMGRLHERYSGHPAERKASGSSQKFGTGEGHLNLVPSHEYSPSAFESSFQGMGLDPEQSRSLGGELGRGGAVVTVHAGERASLAEGIIERNHGHVRLETSAAASRETDRESSVEVYGAMCAWYPGEHAQRRAS
jgi:hypothetical protein